MTSASPPHRRPDQARPQDRAPPRLGAALSVDNGYGLASRGVGGLTRFGGTPSPPARIVLPADPRDRRIRCLAHRRLCSWCRRGAAGVLPHSQVSNRRSSSSGSSTRSVLPHGADLHSKAANTCGRPTGSRPVAWPSRQPRGPPRRWGLTSDAVTGTSSSRRSVTCPVPRQRVQFLVSEPEAGRRLAGGW